MPARTLTDFLAGFFYGRKCYWFGFNFSPAWGKAGKEGTVTFKTMLVEDSPSFRRVLKDSLKNRFPSMGIIEAGDGVEAFQKIDSNLPDLVFMDIHLPGENGLELTRKIKADYPNIIITNGL